MNWKEEFEKETGMGWYINTVDFIPPALAPRQSYVDWLENKLSTAFNNEDSSNARSVSLSRWLGSARAIARQARRDGGDWTRREMLDYLEITESQKTNDELWNDVVDVKEKQLKEIFASAST